MAKGGQFSRILHTSRGRNDTIAANFIIVNFVHLCYALEGIKNPKKEKQSDVDAKFAEMKSFVDSMNEAIDKDKGVG